MSQIDDERDDDSTHKGTESQADHQHAVPGEEPLEGETHLDTEVYEKHFERKPFDVPCYDDAVELGQHCCHIHQPHEPDDASPADFLGDCFSRHCSPRLLVERAVVVAERPDVVGMTFSQTLERIGGELMEAEVEIGNDFQLSVFHALVHDTELSPFGGHEVFSRDLFVYVGHLSLLVQ